MMLKSLLLLTAVVACAHCFLPELESFLGKKSEYAKCKKVKSVKKIDLDSIAGKKLYVNYIAINDPTTQEMIKTLDSDIVTLDGTEQSRVYNVMGKVVDVDQKVTSFNQNVTIPEGYEKYAKIVSYEQDKYALIYICVSYNAVQYVGRFLVISNLTTDVTAPLKLDKRQHFNTKLYGLPFNYISLIDN